MDIRSINRAFATGVLPPELDFSRKPDPIDFEKVRYNSFYRSPEYFLSRFPDPEGFLNLPGGMEILEAMAANATSPGEEMDRRRAEAAARQEISASIETEDGVDYGTCANHEEQSQSPRCTEEQLPVATGAEEDSGVSWLPEGRLTEQSQSADLFQ